MLHSIRWLCVSVVFWCALCGGGALSGWGAWMVYAQRPVNSGGSDIQILPNYQTLSQGKRGTAKSSARSKKATSQPTSKAASRAKEAESRATQVDAKRREKVVLSGLLLQTRIPFAVTMLGGLGAMVTGLCLLGSEPFAANLLLSSGTSVLFASVSSYMWWSPSLYLGMLGGLLGVASLVGGIVLATGVTGFPSEMGWGLLGASLLHLILNLVGWLNLRGVLGSAKKTEGTKRAEKALTKSIDLQILPYLSADRAGVICRVLF